MAIWVDCTCSLLGQLFTLVLRLKSLVASVTHLKSCHVIVRNRLSLSMGLRDVAAGANPSLVHLKSNIIILTYQHS